MRDAENIRLVTALKPDYIGSIFYEKSPRFYGDREVVSAVPARKVGVFVNASEAYIKEMVSKHNITMLQLHGDESPEFCNNLRKQGFDVIKVFRVDSQFNFQQTHEFDSVANYFLFDTKGEKYGGNARAFDWRVLENYNQRVPFFLSGGLDAHNISGMESLSQMNIHALDLNSGVEVSPGVKDVDKIKEVITNLSKINQHGIPGR